jgi:molybdopterin-binding protein
VIWEFLQETSYLALFEEVRLGEIMAHVIVRVGESVVESVITRTGAEELNLKKGDSVRVVVKSLRS